jgi:Flp pilus assembly protein TadG
MAYQKNSPVLDSAKKRIFPGRSARHDRGAVMPFVAMSVILMLGTLGIAIDVMRSFETVGQLQFAAQTAALYGSSLATNPDGSYSTANAQNNILSSLSTLNSANWNSAQSGPINNLWSEPVTFAQSDMLFPTNPLDSSEFFFDLTDRRQGNEALQQFFLPLLYTSLTKVGVPLSVQTMSTYQTVEAIGQPASRIGAGAPLNSTLGTTTPSLVGFASLPIAISNNQLSIIANPSQTGTTYTIDLISSKNAGVQSPTHIKGCLVNVGTFGGSTNYYGGAQGDLAINQLEGLFNYFIGSQSANTINPAFVERGSQLSAFDPADPAFIARQSEISKVISNKNLLNKFFIVPVLANDPSFTGANSVAGFARLKLDSINTAGVGGSAISITIDIGESVPVRNACSVTGLASVPTALGTVMPAPVYPFLPRQWDSSSNGISVRPRGIVLAPALSPRPISSLFHPS